MFFTLIATLFAGLAGAGMVMLLRTILKDRVPKWATPIAAGAAMIAATIGSEYAWYDGTLQTLPAGMEVVATRENQSWWRPWTFVVPYTDGFVAVDQSSVRTNDAVPGVHLLNVYVFARWQAATQIPSLVDCIRNRRADVIDGIEFDENGTPIDADWREVAPDDALLAAVCVEAVS
ncbi:hypothetical protein [Rhodophyticola sp.]|jgi:hypothetical protein|uniref:hypothetical protein n=1 Tax=Rhodophyticola sp. TaxID=2680032 RepID=UPI001AFF914D|nr:hypothetical protein [Roseicyclus sp.]MBO6624109.1 hypothetical protein [Roseicyclus sp.]MBO6923213.1 hypothetical protein [Roseicyclus sp.]